MPHSLRYIEFRWVVRRIPLSNHNCGINLAASATRTERSPAALLWIIQHALIFFTADLYL